jgi:hypothetical protein
VRGGIRPSSGEVTNHSRLFTLLAVMGGAVRTVLERGALDDELATLRAELPRVCRAYLASCVRSRRDAPARVKRA